MLISILSDRYCSIYYHVKYIKPMNDEVQWKFIWQNQLIYQMIIFHLLYDFIIMHYYHYLLSFISISPSIYLLLCVHNWQKFGQFFVLL